MPPAPPVSPGSRRGSAAGPRRRRHRERDGHGGVDEFVARVLARAGATKAVREHRLVLEWREIVGDRIAARTWPSGLREGVLNIRAANSAWMHELGFLKNELIARANAWVGAPPLVTGMRFHLGAPKQEEADDVVAALVRRRAPPPPPPPRPRPSSETLRQIDADTARVTDPELRAAIHAFRRAAGV